MTEAGHTIDGETMLKRRQRWALAWLVFAAAVFIGAFFLEPVFWVRLAKSGAEAAMVGGLADWFAVVALFRHPLGLPIPHTAIVPRSKDGIADKLAVFVKEKFLNPDVLIDLIKRSNPAQLFADWMSMPRNARLVGRHAANLISHGLDLVDEKSIQVFIRDAARTVLGKLNFAQALGSVLEMLTKGGRHQQLLDSALEYVVTMLQDSTFREEVTKRTIAWIKTEHKWKQMLLPTDSIGSNVADAVSTSLKQFLEEVAGHPKHELRATFDRAIQAFVVKLKTDAEFQRKGEEFKDYVQNNPEIAKYARDLWAELRNWLSNDLESGSASHLQEKVQSIGLWLGQKMAGDQGMRDSINEHMASLAQSAAPQFANFLTGHISNTVRKWDAKDMSRQIELSIGPDLQFIRISGTFVGGCIGVLLFLCAYGINEVLQ